MFVLCQYFYTYYANEAARNRKSTVKLKANAVDIDYISIAAAKT